MENTLKRSTEYTCNTCGQTFQKPVFAAISAGTQKEEYYACPRCLSRIEEYIDIASEEQESQSAPLPSQKQSMEVLPENCSHHFGYLKKRRKDEPFPEECLTCKKMIECIYA
jgi:DNA-directed RNA polymerase subunit RPC12/RpoP